MRGFEPWLREAINNNLVDGCGGGGSANTVGDLAHRPAKSSDAFAITSDSTLSSFHKAKKVQLAGVANEACQVGQRPSVIRLVASVLLTRTVLGLEGLWPL